MIEFWKDITNYEGFYKISNLGRVKSLKRYCLRKDGIKRIIMKQKQYTIKEDFCAKDKKNKIIMERRDYYRQLADSLLDKFGLFSDKWHFCMKMAGFYNELLINNIW